MQMDRKVSERSHEQSKLIRSAEQTLCKEKVALIEAKHEALNRQTTELARQKIKQIEESDKDSEELVFQDFGTQLEAGDTTGAIKRQTDALKKVKSQKEEYQRIANSMIAQEAKCKNEKSKYQEQAI